MNRLFLSTLLFVTACTTPQKTRVPEATDTTLKPGAPTELQSEARGEHREVEPALRGRGGERVGAGLGD